MDMRKNSEPLLVFCIEKLNRKANEYEGFVFCFLSPCSNFFVHIFSANFSITYLTWRAVTHYYISLKKPKVAKTWDYK